METNNGRTGVENPTMEELQNENTQLKQYLNQAANEIQQLRQILVHKRADYLFKVVENDEFSAEFKIKAIEEIEEFLYPKVENNTNEE